MAPPALSGVESTVSLSDEPRPSAIRKGACQPADPASTQTSSRSVQHDEKCRGDCSPDVYGAGLKKLSPVLEVSEHSPPQEEDAPGEATANMNDTMVVDTVNSAHPENGGTQSDVATPAMEGTAALQPGVGGCFSANPMEVEKSADAGSSAEQSPTFGTMREGFFEKMAISCVEEDDEQLKDGHSVTVPQSEAFSNAVCENGDTLMPQYDGQLDERGDLTQLQSHLSGTRTPTALMGQSQQGLRPLDWFSNAPAPSVVTPSSLSSSRQAAETSLWDPDVQRTQPLASNAWSEVPDLWSPAEQPATGQRVYQATPRHRGRTATQSMNQTARKPDRLRSIRQIFEEQRRLRSRPTPGY